MEIVRSDSYYFTRLVVFKVENTLFRVPQERFENLSDVFHTMFTLPCEGVGQQDGSRDEQPLVLDGIKADNFLQFLRQLYPQASQIGEKQDNVQLSAALSLAQMWGFSDICASIIKALDEQELSTVRKLELARLHNIDDWFYPEMQALADRTQTLTIDEANRIGLDLTVLLLNLRDEKQQRSTEPGCPFHKKPCLDCIGRLDGQRAMNTLLESIAQRKGWPIPSPGWFGSSSGYGWGSGLLQTKTRTR